jgi:hypothetical protein
MDFIVGSGIRMSRSLKMRNQIIQDAGVTPQCQILEPNHCVALLVSCSGLASGELKGAFQTSSSGTCEQL